MAKEGNATTTDGLGDGRETGGRGDLIVPDELMPLDQRLNNGIKFLKLSLMAEYTFSLYTRVLTAYTRTLWKSFPHLR